LISSYSIFLIALLIKFLSTHLLNIGLVFKMNLIYCSVKKSLVE
jgi:hypothetical protein